MPAGPAGRLAPTPPFSSVWSCPPRCGPVLNPEGARAGEARPPPTATSRHYKLKVSRPKPIPVVTKVLAVTVQRNGKLPALKNSEVKQPQMTRPVLEYRCHKKQGSKYFLAPKLRGEHFKLKNNSKHNSTSVRLSNLCPSPNKIYKTDLQKQLQREKINNK